MAESNDDDDGVGRRRRRRRRSNERGGAEYELSYWKYPARNRNRAVSEPNLQTMRVLGTRVLQKSNSSRDVNDSGRGRPLPAVEPFGPKLMTWLYVSKAQCSRINFTKTDGDLLKVFHDATFRWTVPNETAIVSRLLADVAKFCKKHKLTDEKMSAVLGIYYYAHSYNKSLDATISYREIYNFFKELIIHHSVSIAPYRVRLFSAEDAKNILAHFLNTYLICLPLIRHICVPPSSTSMHVHRKRNDSHRNV